MPLTLLLPARSRFDGQAVPDGLARLLGRADRPEPGKTGAREQLQRHLSLLPRGWPIAALTRALDAGDAEGYTWLRADPVHVRADLNAVRLMGWGHLQLTQAEADALLKPLKLLFGDTGFPISAPVAERWYLMLPREAKLPAFVDPEQVLGDEIHDHLPDGDAGRRWRQLLNEAQILLHNHPVNLERAARGLPEVNSLWFWGGGTLPSQVTCAAGTVFTREVTLAALARHAGLAAGAVPPRWTAAATDALVDLRNARSLEQLHADWIAPGVAAAGTPAHALMLDFADGHRFALSGAQRWRLWRRPLRSLS